VNLMPPFCKIFSPALGMDAATVSNEGDFHKIPPRCSGVHVLVIITISSPFRVLWNSAP
jgi:hypothetical protein